MKRAGARSAIPAVLTLLALAPAPALANSFEDTLGSDARVKAMGGAGTALAAGPATAYYNFAALAVSRQTEISGSFDLVYHDLYLESVDPAADASVEVANLYTYGFGLAGPFLSRYECPECGAPRHRLDGPCAKCSAEADDLDPWYLRLYYGALFSQSALHPTYTKRTTATGPERPIFALLGHRLEKMTMCGGIAFRIVDGFALGLGASLLADSLVHTRTDVSALTGEPADVEYEYDMGRTAAIHAGALVEPIDGLRLGAAFRSALSHQLTAYTTTAVNVLGVVTEYPLRIDAVTWYSPLQAAVGAAYRWEPVTLAGDVTWYHWSDYPGPYNRIEVIDAPGSGLIGGAAAPDPRFSDTISARVGGELRFLDRWAARLGYGLHLSPAPEPTARYDLLDCHRHALSAGGGVELGSGNEGERPVRIDLALALHLLQRRSVTRDDPGLELHKLSYGGVIVDPALTAAYRF